MSTLQTTPRKSHPRTTDARRRLLARTKSDAALGFELYRQHTLLVVLAAGLRHTAARVLETHDVAEAEVARALEIHREYLINVHYPDEERVMEALEPSKDAAAFDALVECKAEHPRASAFQQAVASLMDAAHRGSPTAAEEVARRLRQEAERIERHLTREEENLTSRLGQWLPSSVQQQLLQQIREFDNRRITAEDTLLVWAAEIAPSVD